MTSVTLVVTTDEARLIAAVLGEQPSARCGAAWQTVVRQLAEQSLAVELVAMDPTGKAENARMVNRQVSLLVDLQESLSGD